MKDTKVVCANGYSCRHIVCHLGATKMSLESSWSRNWFFSGSYVRLVDFQSNCKLTLTETSTSTRQCILYRYNSTIPSLHSVVRSNSAKLFRLQPRSEKLHKSQEQLLTGRSHVTYTDVRFQSCQRKVRGCHTEDAVWPGSTAAQKKDA
jgi:hypothetical protein